MSMTDPIADMLTRIRNAQSAGHAHVLVPRSNVKLALVRLLKDEGYVDGWVEQNDDKQGKIKIFLKYEQGEKGVIRGIERISKPGRRQYVGRDDIPRVRNGTDRQAREAGVGGELLCRVW
jgi:small subunit ribosomal protein S8